MNSAVRKTGEQQLNVPFIRIVSSTWLRGLLSIARPGSAVVALAVVAISLWLWGRHFPLGVHLTEPTKVDSVLRASNFHHPLLMIDLVRAANAFIGLMTPQSIVELGRGFAALAGGTLIIATFILGRLVVPAWIACVAAVAALATPLITVHARYFKEDIFVAPFIVLALAALIVVLKKPTLERTIGLGALIGLAAGSKFVGGLLLLPYALVAMISYGNRKSMSARVTDAGIAALTAAGVFLLIEFPALFQTDRLLTDVMWETHRAMGDLNDLNPIISTWGTFHLRHGLWLGLGPLFTILGLIGVSAAFVTPSKRRQPLAVITGFAVLWYFAHEISPLKPAVDSERYMVPLAPLLIVLAAALIYESVEQWRAGAGTTVAIIVLLVAAIPTAWLSLRINTGTSDDPRKLLPEIIANAAGSLTVDRYAGNDTETLYLARRHPLPSAASSTIVVTSSFNYERYQSWPLLPQQPENVQEVAAFFARALALPRIDVSNGRPTFGFFNPTTTVIAMDGNPQRLVPVAEAIATTAPAMVVRWKGLPTTPHFLQGKADEAARQH